MTEIKQPKIRFKGYINDWKQRKLGEVVNNIATGKSKFKKNDNFSENGYEILGSTGVIGYDSEYDYNGDFLLTARVGANAGSLYTHKGKVKITDNTVFIEYNNISFLYNILEKFDLKRLSFGTGQPLIKASELKKLDLYFPVDEEQTKISEFFKTLDDTIALHQQKLEVTKQFKQTMLKKMFPKNGETTPEIRFKGFTEDWEECKLGDFDIKFEKGTLPSKNSDVLGEFKFYNTGKKVLNSNIYNFDYIQCIVVSAHGSVGNIHNSHGKIGVSDGCYVLTSTDFDLNYLYISCQKYLKNYLNLMKTGTIISHTSLNDFKNCKIRIPTDSDEKLKIGLFFIELEKEIKALEKQIEVYKEFKKTMLQKMFL